MAAQQLAVRVGVAPACQALNVSRATFYRRQWSVGATARGASMARRARNSSSTIGQLRAAPLGEID